MRHDLMDTFTFLQETRERAMQAHYIIDFGDVAHGMPWPGTRLKYKWKKLNWRKVKSKFYTHFNIVQFSLCVLPVQIFSSKCIYMEYVCSRSNLQYWYLISSIFNNFLLCFCAGDPLYEFLALHISVFKLDPVLLKLCLRAYGLPLTIPSAIGKVANGDVLTDASSRDYTRPSYRAM